MTAVGATKEFQGQLDSRALETAVKTEQRQKDHEELCAMRWGAVLAVSKATLYVVIMTLLTVTGSLGWFLLNHLKWQ